MKKYLKVNDNGAGVTHLRIDIMYNKGAESYGYTRGTKRGYYLYVTPVTRYARDGIPFESFEAYSGARILLHECARKSAKAEKESERIADADGAHLVNAVLGKNGLTLAEV